MNGATQLEHRASSRLRKHEGEPSFGLCDRLDRTRDNSQRQLPTDHDYAVPTREYQTDQSSLKTAPTAARSVFGKGKQRQRQKQPRCCAVLTRSLHIRPMHLLMPGEFGIRPHKRRCHRLNLYAGVRRHARGTSDPARAKMELDPLGVRFLYEILSRCQLQKHNRSRH